ncbi:MAG: FkbM family methyltransferase [Anaerolineae bacterium]|nr:FkbM family methyltransferase [Anaerolineae bacterium]
MDRIKQWVRAFFYAIIRLPAGSPTPRAWLNALYLRLGSGGQYYAHKLFARAFRGVSRSIPAGTWMVRFFGKPIILPLRAASFWLDWDTALSILGHEPHVKRTYAAAIAGGRPDLFVDIGANYGTHSLLFLSQGVETLTFEPNAACHDYFREACALNSFTPALESVALGAAAGELELVFPEQETWLGATDAAAQSALAGQANLIRRRVEMRPLTAYAERFAGRRALVKIDTEGAELDILRGAADILRNHAPLLIFESFPGEQRGRLFDLLAGVGYRITPLPWSPGGSAAAFTRDGFLASGDMDFFAAK